MVSTFFVFSSWPDAIRSLPYWCGIEGTGWVQQTTVIRTTFSVVVVEVRVNGGWLSCAWALTLPTSITLAEGTCLYLYPGCRIGRCIAVMRAGLPGDGTPQILQKGRLVASLLTSSELGSTRKAWVHITHPTYSVCLSLRLLGVRRQEKKDQGFC